jgi:hypothetical protein
MIYHPNEDGEQKQDDTKGYGERKVPQSQPLGGIRRKILV